MLGTPRPWAAAGSTPAFRLGSGVLARSGPAPLLSRRRTCFPLPAMRGLPFSPTDAQLQSSSQPSAELRPPLPLFSHPVITRPPTSTAHPSADHRCHTACFNHGSAHCCQHPLLSLPPITDHTHPQFSLPPIPPHPIPMPCPLQGQVTCPDAQLLHIPARPSSGHRPSTPTSPPSVVPSLG